MPVVVVVASPFPVPVIVHLNEVLNDAASTFHPQASALSELT